MRAIEKVAKELANSSLTEDDLRVASQQISHDGWRYLISLVMELRGSRRYEADSRGQVSTSRTARTNSSATVAAQIDDLLRKDAGLSAGEAAALLIDGLDIERSRIPSPTKSKISFQEWLERLSMSVPPRELLRLATLIRNGLVHRERSDWPLKR